MGALLGALASMCVGGSELFGRRVSLQSGPISASVAMQLLAALTALATALLLPSEVIGPDILRGCLSGVGMASGMICYLTGLTRSTSAVIAPLTAVLAAIIPFSYSAVTGSTPSIIALGGAALAMVGLALIAAGRAPASGFGKGVIWGLGSGLSYGIALSLVIDTNPDGGAFPAAAQRSVAFLLIIALAVSRNRPLIPKPGFRMSALLAGALAGGASVFYLFGVQANASAATITGSMFPAISVAVGRFSFHDSVTKAQVVGLAVTLAGVLAVVTG